MESEDFAANRLCLLLGLLVLLGLGSGVYAVFFAEHLKQVISFAPRIEPLSIRDVGMY